MLPRIYSVYDAKSKIFDLPFFIESIGDALRGFDLVSNDKKSKIGAFPEDFSLFEVGTYCKLSAKFDIYQAPIHVVNAIDLVKKNKLNHELDMIS